MYIIIYMCIGWCIPWSYVDWNYMYYLNCQGLFNNSLKNISLNAYIYKASRVYYTCFAYKH